jgi:hypothetical protein
MREITSQPWSLLGKGIQSAARPYNRCSRSPIIHARCLLCQLLQGERLDRPLAGFMSATDAKAAIASSAARTPLS